MARACYGPNLHVTSGSISVKSDPQSSIRCSCAHHQVFRGRKVWCFETSCTFILILIDLCFWHGFGHWHRMWCCKTNLLWYLFQILPLALRLFVSSKQSLGSLIQTNMTGNVVWSNKTGFTSESVPSPFFRRFLWKSPSKEVYMGGNVVGCSKNAGKMRKTGFYVSRQWWTFSYQCPKTWFLGFFLKTSVQTVCWGTWSTNEKGKYASYINGTLPNITQQLLTFSDSFMNLLLKAWFEAVEKKQEI